MNLYLERYAWKDNLFPTFFPSQDLELIIVIPCFIEPEVEKSLLSINACASTNKILVILVVNESVSEEKSICQQNQQSIDSVSKLNLNYELLISHIKLPEKKAGVGLARKIGMDQAVRIFEESANDGIIACFDADCLCESNYIDAILEFYQNSNNECGIVHYEHDLTVNTQTIIDYEIHLRYYINGLRWAGFTNAYQTLGSCITVKSKRYQKEGGMMTRKAGEDFYFLHKVIPNGQFGEIYTTTVYPSARISDRVPFGTGHAIAKNLGTTEFETYHPEIFDELKTLITQLKVLYLKGSCLLNKEVMTYLDSIQFSENISRIRKESVDFENFQSRFFRWFDGFKTLKLVHHLRDSKYPSVSISSAIDWLIKNVHLIEPNNMSRQDVLRALRKHDLLDWNGQ